MTKVSQYPCSNCGADTKFGPGTGSLICAHCDTKTKIERLQVAIVENDYSAAIAAAPAQGTVVNGQTEIQCKTCGARTLSQSHATRCAFCDSALVTELPPEPTVLPQAVLPFEVTAQTAKDSFVKWLSSRWFAPFRLVKKAKRDGMDGVYIPYWTFDAQTVTRYEGERGEYYWDTETYRDSNGNTQTRQVRRTRWYDASGTVDVPFDDVLVCGSTSLPSKIVNKLEPWDLENLAPFDGRYIAGFMAERQKVDLKDAYGTSKERMDPHITMAIRQDIGGDEQRIHHKDTTYNQVTWKHVMMPLWLSAFRFGERVFRVTVNARTGEVSGERPYSVFKIVALIVIIIAVIVGLVLAFSKR